MKLKVGSPIQNKQSGFKKFGTLGGFVKDLATDEVLGITAYHTVQTAGLPWKSFEADDIADKGLLEVAMLNEAHDKKVVIGDIYKTSFDEFVDVALIKFRDDLLAEPEFKSTGSCLYSELSEGDDLTMSGTVTSNGNGNFIKYIEEKLAFPYRGHDHSLELLMLIGDAANKPFSQKGDSGSIIYKHGKAAGVILGGEGSTTYGMAAYFIEANLNISF
jgi:hypothetical protein